MQNSALRPKFHECIFHRNEIKDMYVALEEKEKEMDDALKTIVEQNADFKKVWMNQSEHYWNQCWGKIRDRPFLCTVFCGCLCVGVFRPSGCWKIQIVPLGVRIFPRLCSIERMGGSASNRTLFV